MISIEERLARLERQVNRWRIICVVVLLASVGILAAGAQRAADPGPKDAVVRSLKVVDADGNPSIVLLAGAKRGDGATIGIAGTNGEPAFKVGVRNGEGLLQLAQQGGGKAAVSLMAGKPGAAVMLDRDSGDRAAMIYSEKGEGRISLYKDSKTAIWDAPSRR